MHVECFYFNPFRECTYLLSDDNGNTIVIDCGCSNNREQQRITQYIDTYSLTIRYHLLTHAHIDHVWGAEFIYRQYGVRPLLSQKDDWLFQNISLQAQMFGLAATLDTPIEYTPIESKATLNGEGDYELLFLNELSCPITAIPTPGHTEGGVCYYFPNENILFSGDTLFENGIGRTDLMGGNYGTLLKSLNKIKLLPDDTIVYPGHGYQTTIGHEKQFNPYL